MQIHEYADVRQLYISLLSNLSISKTDLPVRLENRSICPSVPTAAKEQNSRPPRKPSRNVTSAVSGFNMPLCAECREEAEVVSEALADGTYLESDTCDNCGKEL